MEYYQQHPGDAAPFDAAMSSVCGQEATAIRAAYDFSQFATLVDVGGGHRLVLAGLSAGNTLVEWDRREPRAIGGRHS